MNVWVSCRVGFFPCEASWAAAFPAITVSISFCWFCVFYAASFSNCNHFPQMDALKIGSFKMFQRVCIYYEKCHKIFHRKNLGQKHLWGEDSYMFLDPKKLISTWLRTHLNRCQPGLGASRHVISPWDE